MSVATRTQSSAKPVTVPRAILGPAGNRVRVSEDPKRKIEAPKKPQRPKAPIPEVPQAVVRKNVSIDSSCSSDSSSSSSSVKLESSRKTVIKRIATKPVKPKPASTTDETAAEADSSPKSPGPLKRCDWITPYSDLVYTSFHDEEWGVPVHDDKRLFELLVFSQALAELSWLAILSNRDIFRKLFDSFDPSSVAQFNEKKLLSLKVNGNLVLSEPKLQAIVGNAKQTLKVQQEFGSFSNYCWGFVNNQPVKNGFRYARLVPAKTPKAEAISKDMMRRGFRCVGPTVIYSFMQVAGIVNDHLASCFRYHECNAKIKIDTKPQIKEEEVLNKDLEEKCLVS